MEFLFPFPAEAGGAERGFVKGFVDFIFEHEGRSYFGDWKTDRLPGVGRRHGRRARRRQLRAAGAAVLAGAGADARHHRRGDVRGALRRHALRLRARPRPLARRRSAAGRPSFDEVDGLAARRSRARWNREIARERRGRHVRLAARLGARPRARPPPTSTMRRSTSPSRPAAGRRPSCRAPSAARSRWSCSRRWTSRGERGDAARLADGRRAPRAAGRRGRRSRRGRRAAGRGAAGAAAALAPFVGRPGDYRPFIVDGGFLYHERDLRLEQRLADALAARLAAPPLPAPAGAAATHERSTGRWTWSAQQRRGDRRRRAGGRWSVISGGPGTGKTALIGGIVRAWLATGIARRRASRSRRPRARPPTASPSCCRPPRARPDHAAPPARLQPAAPQPARRRLPPPREPPPAPRRVIVDEASMVGLSLMEQLVRALRARRAAGAARRRRSAPRRRARQRVPRSRRTGHAVRLTDQPPHGPGRSGGRGRAGRRARDRGRRPRRRCSTRGRAAAPSSARASPACQPDGQRRRRRGAGSSQAFVDHWYAAWIKPGRRGGAADASGCARTTTSSSRPTPPPPPWPRSTASNGRAC